MKSFKEYHLPIDEEKDEYGELLIEMSNLFPEDHGIPGVSKIWITTASGKEKHKLPRFKVEYANNKSAVYVYIKDEVKYKTGNKPPSKLDKSIVRWAIINREAMTDHYYGKTSSRQFVFSIVSLNSQNTASTVPMFKEHLIAE